MKFKFLVPIIGTLFLVTGIVSGIQSYLFLKSSLIDEGEVIRLETFNQRSDNFQSRASNTAYFPVIRFTSSEGTEHIFVSEVYSNTKSDYIIGNKLSITYNRSNPEQAELSQKDYYSFFKRFSAFGIVLIVGWMIWRRS